MKYWLILLCLFCAANVYAQGGRVKNRQFYPNEVEPTPNEPYKRSSYRVNNESREVADWMPVNPKDVLWRKDVWRIIDLSDKRNELMQYVYGHNDSSITLVRCLYEIVKSTDSVSAYAFSDDTSYTLNGIDLQEIVEYNKDSVVAYGLYENWQYDRKFGRMVVRINAISPMVRTKDGELAALFWVNYMKVRLLLNDYYIKGVKENIIFTDYLENRFFYSKITKTRTPLN